MGKNVGLLSYQMWFLSRLGNFVLFQMTPTVFRKKRKKKRYCLYNYLKNPKLTRDDYDAPQQTWALTTFFPLQCASCTVVLTYFPSCTICP